MPIKADFCRRYAWRFYNSKAAAEIPMTSPSAHNRTTAAAVLVKLRRFLLGKADVKALQQLIAWTCNISLGESDFSAFTNNNIFSKYSLFVHLTSMICLLIPLNIYYQHSVLHIFGLQWYYWHKNKV